MAETPDGLYGMPPSAFEALNSMYADNLADKLKPLESSVDAAVPPTQPFVIRLDGVAFSTFTKGLPRPFDPRLTEAMVSTTVDLLTKFSATLAYTQSDEISLVFPAQMGPFTPSDLQQRDEMKAKGRRGVKRKAAGDDGKEEEGAMETDSATAAGPGDLAADAGAANGSTAPGGEQQTKRVEVQRTHPYNGRVQKLASCTASYASARLNYYLQKKDWSHLDPASQARMVSATAYFDGRVVPCPTPSDCADCIFWRSNFDGFRNAIGQVARAYLSNIPRSTAGQKDAQTKLHGRGSREMLGLLWNQAKLRVFGEGAVVPPRFLFGTWIKKERYELQGCVNPKTGKPVEGPVWRTRVRIGSFNWADWSEQERAEFAMSKFWPGGPRAPPRDPLEGSDVEADAVAAD